MDGYTFMLERNRLLSALDRQLRDSESLPEKQRQAAREKAEAAFHDALSRIYAELDGCVWKITADGKKQDTGGP